MPKGKANKTSASATRIESTRTQFRTLIASNPNYFGNLEKSKFKVVKKIVLNKSFEELTSVGYNQHIKRLYATVDIKKSGGYGGDLCDDGSTEYVRFFVDFGAGWADVGLVATNVHDIPANIDCQNKASHPLSYSLELPYSPPRKWCTAPQLPRVRAILSFNIAPPAGNPNYKPVYGNVVECAIQIDKSWLFDDFLGVLDEQVKIPSDLLKSVKPILKPVVPELPDIPDLPEPPLPPIDVVSMAADEVPLEELARKYSKSAKSKGFEVEPSRFGFAAVQQLAASPSHDVSSFQNVSSILEQFDIDLGSLVLKVEDTTGNISYEELVDVGLDSRREKLVATYNVKKPSGFSGNLCSSGSVEHVAFWADWEDTCEWTYLGTVGVRAYDLGKLPSGGLCYSASLPVDLDEFKRRCHDPKVARIRAVLSWNSPPSTVDPDAVPTWGNRLDAHALIPREEGAPGTIDKVGGVSVEFVSDTTGLVSPTAKFADTGTDVYTTEDRWVPFGGLVVIRGASISGKRYRLRVVDSDGDSETLTEKIWVTPSALCGPSHFHEGTPDGWFNYLPNCENTSNKLGYYRSRGMGKVTIELEVEGDGVVDSQVIKLDNEWPEVGVQITEPGSDCGFFTPGTQLKGLVQATDVDAMGHWSVVIDGGPAGFGPVAVLSGNFDTAAGGDAWAFDTTDLEQCGYVVRVHANDRAIVNSGNHQHSRSDDVGFCIIED